MTMIKCDESCIPCCDYCIHAQYERQPIVGRAVIGCRQHEDEKHQQIAVNLGIARIFTARTWRDRYMYDKKLLHKLVKKYERKAGRSLMSYHIEGGKS